MISIAAYLPSFVSKFFLSFHNVFLSSFSDLFAPFVFRHKLQAPDTSGTTPRTIIESFCFGWPIEFRNWILRCRATHSGSGFVGPEHRKSGIHDSFSFKNVRFLTFSVAFLLLCSRRRDFRLGRQVSAPEHLSSRSCVPNDCPCLLSICPLFPRPNIPDAAVCSSLVCTHGTCSLRLLSGSW